MKKQLDAGKPGIPKQTAKESAQESELPFVEIRSKLREAALVSNSELFDTALRVENAKKEIGKLDFSKIPNGGPGIENRMSLIYHYGVGGGYVDLNRFVELTYTGPAKIFGLFPKKGTIAVGSDADIVIFDPNREEVISYWNSHTHHMNVDYNAFEGMPVKGLTETVFSRGRMVIDRGEYVGRAGDGEFVRRGPYGGFYRPDKSGDVPSRAPASRPGI